MRLLLCQLGLSLALLPVEALAEPVASIARPGEAKQAVSPQTASALARVVAPLDIGVSTELEQARRAILALPTLDEDAKLLEKEYPGLYAALWAAVEPEMRAIAEASYPSFWAALEQLYHARLTENEAQAVMTFFKSATGQKLLRSTYSSFDTGPMVAEMANSDNYTVSESQMKAAANAARAKAVGQIGPGDQADLWLLIASIDLAKFQSLGVETQKVTLAWVNKEDPEGDARIEKAMKEAMERYMEAHPPRQ